MEPLKVLFATSEAIPFAKTGGLADVASALPAALDKSGIDCRLILPKYKSVYDQKIKTKKIAEFSVNLSGNVFLGELEEAKHPKSKIPVYFIKNDRFFYRDELYQQSGKDYEDNASRFIFFSRGVLEALKCLDYQPDIIHCNDWQTGLIPAYLKSPLYSNNPFYHGIKTVFTIHNLAYQGLFWHLDMPLTGLGWEYFTSEKLEFYGKINLLKSGLVFSDQLTTVSPSYSREIQTPQLGCGLDGILRKRSSCLSGIVNGADYDIWSPESDKLIPKKYSLSKIKFKEKNKAALLQSSGLTETDRPVIGIVSRITEHKGFDLLISAFSEIMSLNLSLVILGRGDSRLEQKLVELAAKYSGRASVRIEFNEELAHLVFAGSDLFLMPSKTEPCGLNQIYALKYGTIPVVHKTGGLADTVNDFNPADGTGNGFVFTDYEPLSLIRTLKRALETNQSEQLWKKLMATAMETDHSFDSSAQQYIEIYKSISGRNT